MRAVGLNRGNCAEGRLKRLLGYLKDRYSRSSREAFD